MRLGPPYLQICGSVNSLISWEIRNHFSPSRIWSCWLLWTSLPHTEGFVHSKGCRCNFWGLLHSDDRKSPWWASRVGTQHDRSRFDTVIISKNLNSYASLAIFFIIPDLFFCFWPQNYTYYTRVSCVWFLSPSVSLQSNWTWKLSEPGLSISFSLWRPKFHC